jgi:hypothetical protein
MNWIRYELVISRFEQEKLSNESEQLLFTCNGLQSLIAH